MTAKEAIRILTLERDDWETSHCSPMYRREAFQLAIEALNHSADDSKKVSSSCGQGNDLISRKAAIDKLDPIFESLAIDKIKALPTAQPDTDRIYAELSKAYNVKGLPDEAINIIGNLMLSLDE